MTSSWFLPENDTTVPPLTTITPTTPMPINVFSELLANVSETFVPPTIEYYDTPTEQPATAKEGIFFF